MRCQPTIARIMYVTIVSRLGQDYSSLCILARSVWSIILFTLALPGCVLLCPLYFACRYKEYSMQRQFTTRSQIKNMADLEGFFGLPKLFFPYVLGIWFPDLGESQYFAPGLFPSPKQRKIRQERISVTQGGRSLVQ